MMFANFPDRTGSSLPEAISSLYESEAAVLRRIYHPHTSSALHTIASLHPVHHLILNELFRVEPSVVVSLNKYCYDHFTPKLYQKVDFDVHRIPILSFLHGLNLPNGRKRKLLKLVREVSFYFHPLVHVPKGEVLPDGTRQMIPIDRLEGVHTGHRHSWNEEPSRLAEEIIKPLAQLSEYWREMYINPSLCPGNGGFMPNVENISMCGYMGDYIFTGYYKEDGYVSRYEAQRNAAGRRFHNSGELMDPHLFLFKEILGLGQNTQHSAIQIPILPLNSRGKTHYESLCREMTSVYNWTIAGGDPDINASKTYYGPVRSEQHKSHTQMIMPVSIRQMRMSPYHQKTADASTEGEGPDRIALLSDFLIQQKAAVMGKKRRVGEIIEANEISRLVTMTVSALQARDGRCTRWIGVQ
ncbi:hypothetical protein L198_04061 [Cryptococcus wingfieldii CBS 7118]|uniref:Uncharacterized protein n=1 Tax=Cryptococcus wingfieldii CBS 7118 TaxID=1295528 RepID=A0A1E3J9G6_9TREE|nr:hypothetical protein L198_04061 [Cryptococcus wingfieldii CBS 7118]ODN97494.1 hypothetical protein L198_04061 [Cryptococcus wingfieldii CBS 7118]